MNPKFTVNPKLYQISLRQISISLTLSRKQNPIAQSCTNEQDQYQAKQDKPPTQGNSVYKKHEKVQQTEKNG